jgi:hypothetical protein
MNEGRAAPARRLSENITAADSSARGGREDASRFGDVAGMTERHLWAAMMLALDLDTAGSILRGLRVRAGNLDGFVLRRALRGAPLPDVEDYIDITPTMLEAIGEAGLLPFPMKGGRR